MRGRNFIRVRVQFEHGNEFEIIRILRHELSAEGSQRFYFRHVHTIQHRHGGDRIEDIVAPAGKLRTRGVFEIAFHLRVGFCYDVFVFPYDTFEERHVACRVRLCRIEGAKRLRLYSACRHLFFKLGLGSFCRFQRYRVFVRFFPERKDEVGAPCGRGRRKEIEIFTAERAVKERIECIVLCRNIGFGKMRSGEKTFRRSVEYRIVTRHIRPHRNEVERNRFRFVSALQHERTGTFACERHIAYGTGDPVYRFAVFSYGTGIRIFVFLFDFRFYARKKSRRGEDERIRLETPFGIDQVFIIKTGFACGIGTRDAEDARIVSFAVLKYADVF